MNKLYKLAKKTFLTITPLPQACTADTRQVGFVDLCCWCLSVCSSTVSLNQSGHSLLTSFINKVSSEILLTEGFPLFHHSEKTLKTALFSNPRKSTEILKSNVAAAFMLLWKSLRLYFPHSNSWYEYYLKLLAWSCMFLNIVLYLNKNNTLKLCPNSIRILFLN